MTVGDGERQEGLTYPEEMTASHGAEHMRSVNADTTEAFGWRGLLDALPERPTPAYTFKAHPLAIAMIRRACVRAPVSAQHPWNLNVSGLGGIPLVADADLPSGCWRLMSGDQVVEEGNVLTGQVP